LTLGWCVEDHHDSDSQRAPLQTYNYLPRVTQPVLILNGRWDIDATPDAQQRLFELLGSPAHQKEYTLFEAGHGNLPRFQVEKQTLEWFDRHLVTLPGPPPVRAAR
jgi:pimeloyl-ACP methyl ester carboxylesterase